VPPVPPAPLPVSIDEQAQADDAEDSEDLSVSSWKTLACHLGEAAQCAREIGDALGLPARLVEIVELAARWHDLGKAHPAFQGAIRRDLRPPNVALRSDLAKAPDGAWVRPPGSYRVQDGDTRRGFRHELASALGLFAILERFAPDHPALLGPWAEVLVLTGGKISVASETEPTPIERAVLDCTAEEFDLLAYLVIAHHGKVRVALHASPKDQDYKGDPERGMPIRGVLEGDELPSVSVQLGAPPIAPLRLTLEPAVLGLSSRTGRSWRERTLDLQARFGPGALAWLEGLVIAADRRASRMTTPDPSLATDGEAR
jgi:CRISPR-associated endonuclease/helicase Cas3